MTSPYQILIPLLSLFWVRVDLTDLFPLSIPVELVDVLDGDTLVLRNSRRLLRVRLSRIDAPELGQTFHGTTRDAGAFSRRCLEKIIPDKGELLVEGFDVYHRILGDFEGINFRAVGAGCTGLYPHARFSSVREKWVYLRALVEAKRNRRGVWTHGGYVVPKKWRKLSRRSARRPWPPRPRSRGPYPPGRKFAHRGD